MICSIRFCFLFFCYFNTKKWFWNTSRGGASWALFLVAFPWEASELGLPAPSSVYACRSFPGLLSQQNQRLTPLPLPCLQEFGCSFSCPRLANTENGVRGSSHDGREKKAKPYQNQTKATNSSWWVTVLWGHGEAEWGWKRTALGCGASLFFLSLL